MPDAYSVIGKFTTDVIFKMNVWVLMCEEWNLSGARKTIVREKQKGPISCKNTGDGQIRQLSTVQSIQRQIPNLGEF